MVRKIVATAIILFVVPFFVFAAETDNAAPVAEDADSSPSVVTSYFQGVWVGSWPGFEEASKSQDFTINRKRDQGKGICGRLLLGGIGHEKGSYPRRKNKNGGDRTGR